MCYKDIFINFDWGLINSLLFNSEMAFLLQLQNYEPQFPKPNRISLQKQEIQRVQSVTIRLLSFLRENQSTLSFKQMDMVEDNIIAFQIGLAMQVTLIFRCYITCKKLRPLIKITFLHKDKYWCIKSKELLNNVCRTLKSINKLLYQSNIFIVISPQTGEVQLKISSDIMRSNLLLQRLMNILAILLNSIDILRALTPILLYTCNLITQAELKNILKITLKKIFYGLNKDFYRFAEIYEMMPLVNSHYSNQETLNVEEDCYNFNRVLQLYYKQLQDNPFKHYQLFSSFPQSSNEPLIKIQRQLKQLNFPISRQEDRQFPFIFNTIYITQHKRGKDFKMFEGGKGKIIGSHSKFIYDQSVNVHEERKQQSVNKKDTNQRPVIMSTFMKQKGQFERTLLVKMPRDANLTNAKKQSMTIRYQKEILCHFRTSKCKYLPRYFHTTQQNYDYRHFLLMEYVPGLSLSDEMRLTSNTYTLATRLFIFSHIANAIRFLEEYHVAHLDLSPSNIIVDSNKFIKFIDFGQAYHPVTSQRFSLDSPRSDNHGFVYAPGRTFPYAPPETSSRIFKFSSQQDMFSLGVIMFQFLFNSFPLDCSESVLKTIYKSKEYTERIFFAPEKAEYYGQVDFILIIMHLMIKLLDSNEQARPFPLWTYLIIKKLTCSIR